MSRPVSIRDETILEAARAVFLEHGINATTAEVAARAGVSEGSVFKRWKTKGDLFHAAMFVAHDEFPWIRDLGERAGRGVMREQLIELGLEMGKFFQVLVPLVMLQHSAGAQASNEHLKRPDSPPVRAVQKITAYFEAEMRRGRMRRVDPEILARSFIGGLWHYVFMETLTPAGVLPLALESYVRGFVGILAGGVLIEPPSSRSPRP